MGVHIVVDLAYGDCGKGTTVDYLTRSDNAKTVVRFNGGAQAGHNVETVATTSHCFRQFGAGTFAGADTFLSRYMLVSPLHLFMEADELHAKGITNPLERMAIDREALITTPYHIIANKLAELQRGDERHGSCGYGIGETQDYALQFPELALRAGDLVDPDLTRVKLQTIREHTRLRFGDMAQTGVSFEQADALFALHDDALMKNVGDFFRRFVTSPVQIVDGYQYLYEALAENVVFEGAQGVLLDEWFGFHPYTTWSTTTAQNADILLAEAGYVGDITRLGVIKPYMTRHGVGPLVTEDPDLTYYLQDAHNPYNPWQREFRVGHLDIVALRYAREIVGDLDGIVCTNIDRAVALTGHADIGICTEYKYRNAEVLTTIRRLPAASRTHYGERNLDFQSHLTGICQTAKPHYSQHVVPGNEDIMTKLMAALCTEELHAPLVMTSHGPTAAHKKVYS